MNRNHWTMWAAAAVMAAALSVGTAGRADARLGMGIRMPVDDAVEADGIGANHQVGDGLATLRRVGLDVIKPVMYLLPDDWGWLQLPIRQMSPGNDY